MCGLSLVVVSRGYSLVAVYRLLIAVTSLAEHRFWGILGSAVMVHRLSCPPLVVQNLPRPGIEPMSPALAGKFFTTGLPGKSSAVFSF